MNCKNCDKELVGKKQFCSNCGQKNIANLNLKYLFDDFLDNYLNFDSKLFKTIGALIIKPGKLSLEFLKGRRVSFVLPVRLYITISILFFFLLTIIQIIPKPNHDDMSFKETSFSIHDQKIDVSAEKLKEIEMNEGLDAYVRDSLKIDHPASAYMVKKTIMAQNGGDSFGKTVLDQLSIFLLLFIPFIALVYKWTFTKNKYGYIKHVVFNIHFNSFVIVLLIVNEVFDIFIDTSIWGTLLITIGSLAYLFVAIKRFYLRKWWVVLYKMIFLLVGYISLAFIFGILLFFMSLIFTD